MASCTQADDDAEITSNPDITSGTQPIFIPAAELESDCVFVVESGGAFDMFVVEDDDAR